MTIVGGSDSCRQSGQGNNSKILADRRYRVTFFLEVIDNNLQLSVILRTSVQSYIANSSQLKAP
ncbi:hypothetical protein H0901_15895 [Microcystis aeruginosa BLCCF158]|uniref:Uncharacterized protein n=1 Tax=Microcystis aeruginosa BLCC-F158 TaxID=2755316 RepID=A0A841V1U5_MICAE|nr:hypothetical protein [Microcystis aeruginosa]MBC1196692.1 hypothetical protein [Microcystis aeruginosa BLCC-F158]